MSNSDDDNYLKIVGAKIRVERVRRRLSQQELAALIGIDTSAISRIENGLRSSLDVRLIRSIASALRVEASVLM